MKPTCQQLLSGDGSGCRFGCTCAVDQDDWEIMSQHLGGPPRRQ